MAIKIIKKKEKYNKNFDIQNEMIIHSELSHNNIAKLLFYGHDG